MSKASRKGNTLPPLQKRILIYLGENGQKTRNEIAKIMGIAYKSVLFSFRSLASKGLVEVVSSKFYRQQKFPQYWLTDKGILTALKNGVNIQKLEANMEKMPGDHEGEDLMFELIEALEPNEQPLVFDMSYDFYKAMKDKNENFFVIRIPKNVTKERAKKMLEIVKKYPKFANLLRESRKDISKLLEER